MSRAAFIARGFMSNIGRTQPGRGAAPAPAPRAVHRQKEQTMPNDAPAIAAARAEGFRAGVAEALGKSPSASPAMPQGARPDDSKTMLSSMERELARAGLA